MAGWSASGDWRAALDVAVHRTGHVRFRVLCAEENPDVGQRDAYRDLVLRLARGEAPPAPPPPAPPPPWYRPGLPDPEANPGAYPGLAAQAANFAGAVGRAASAALRGDAVLVPDAEYEARLATCRACEFFDAGAGRCRACGCITIAKAQLATERCPKDRWPVRPETTRPG